MATSTYSAVQISGPFALNQTTAGSQSEPAVAGSGDGAFASVFNDGAGVIKARLFSATGAALTSEVTVSGGVAADATPQIARLPDGKFVVTWNDDVGTNNDVMMRIFDAGLVPITSIVRVNPGGTDASNPDITSVAGGGFVIAYELHRSGSDHDIYVQRYDSNGVPLLDPIAIDASSTANSVRPSITGLRDAGFATAYTSSDPLVGGGTFIARAVNNVDGSPRMAPTVANAPGGNNGEVDLAPLGNGGFILSYTNGDAAPYIGALTFGASGAPASSYQITGGGSGQTDSAIAVSEDGFSVVAYTGHPLRQSFGSSAVFQVIAPDGTLTSAWGAPTRQVGIAQTEPSLTWIDSGRFVLAYTNLDYTRTYGTTYGGDGDGSAVTGSVWQMERTTTGDDTADVLWLDGISDRVTTLGGNDVVFAGNGNNTIDLGAGNDAAAGGSGPDALFGGAGTEWLYGVGGNDYLYGGADLDILFGGEGNDFLYGEDGDDYVFGETGDDAMSGGTGIDRLYGGDGNDAIYGGADTDALYGEAGNDALYGDEGDDFLQGGAGNDLLSGGAGNDLFRFEGSGEGIDTITDFQAGTGAGDIVILAGYALTGFADIVGRMAQAGSDVVLMTSSSSVLRFSNTLVSQFAADDFIV